MSQPDVASHQPLDVDALIARIKAEAGTDQDALPMPALVGDALNSAGQADQRPASASALGWLLSALSDEAFLEGAYRTLLGRAPDAVGADAYRRSLARGGSRLLILYILRYSAEGRAWAGEAAASRSHLNLLRQPMLLSRLRRYLKRGGTLSGLLGRMKAVASGPVAGGLSPSPSPSLLSPNSTQRPQLKPAPWLWLYRLAPVKRPLGPFLRFAERRYLRKHPELYAQQAVWQSNQRIDQQHIRVSQVDERVSRLKAEAVETQTGLEHEVQRRERLSKDLDFFRSDLIYHRQQAQELLTALRSAQGQRTQSSYHDQAPAHQGPTARESLVTEPLSNEAIATAAASLQAVLDATVDDRLDAYYVAFEEEFRGSPEQIRATQEGYVADLLGAAVVTPETPVLDLGCGRGEWLGLLAESGLHAQGVDSNRVMVERCRSYGLDARCEDALSALQALPDASLGAVSAFHLIEHLPFALLHALLEQAHRVLCPGGLLILETPNPENVLVGSHTFYHDPTHRNPMTPTATRFLVRYLGFADPEIRRLHPYPESAKVPGQDALTERVNGHLCGPQDFALIARKPKRPVAAQRVPSSTGRATATDATQPAA
ncbi:class I SAM-dependent methyltransferase [Halochromatium roseum]|uniref:class I SAM-dependent methyltransferase n=1 Tax=Halochromatium roseum TaxID=391920 RepID=UPI0019128C4A|nr:class I SAM-dependent methyltransferase [Halochromatium roseum]MBK5938436.1 hypothetical protein [Halochromatium roseum]